MTSILIKMFSINIPHHLIQDLCLKRKQKHLKFIITGIDRFLHVILWHKMARRVGPSRRLYRSRCQGACWLRCVHHCAAESCLQRGAASTAARAPTPLIFPKQRYHSGQAAYKPSGMRLCATFREDVDFMRNRLAVLCGSGELMSGRERCELGSHIIISRR